MTYTEYTMLFMYVIHRTNILIYINQLYVVLYHTYIYKSFNAFCIYKHPFIIK